MATRGPGFSGIALRALVALVLVFTTYNPEGVSYYHWAVAPLLGAAPTAGLASVKALAGIALVTGWVVFLAATRRSIGAGGAVLVLAISAALVWLLLDFGLVRAGTARGVTYVILICTALLLAVGMSWSHMSRRMSGQVDTDETVG